MARLGCASLHSQLVASSCCAIAFFQVANTRQIVTLAIQTAGSFLFLARNHYLCTRETVEWFPAAGMTFCRMSRGDDALRRHAHFRKLKQSRSCFFDKSAYDDSKIEFLCFWREGKWRRYLNDAGYVTHEINKNEPRARKEERENKIQSSSLSYVFITLERKIAHVFITLEGKLAKLRKKFGRKLHVLILNLNGIWTIVFFRVLNEESNIKMTFLFARASTFFE